jgi:integrase
VRADGGSHYLLSLLRAAPPRARRPDPTRPCDPTQTREKRTVTFLTAVETQALLDAPNRSTWAGRRDHALLLTAAQTGLRLSELLGLTRADTQLGTGAHVRTVGKGRKERVAPLTKQNVAVLRVWLRATTDQPETPLFPSRDGGTLTRDAIERRLAQHVKTAEQACPALRSKRVTMHTMRHYVNG